MKRRDIMALVALHGLLVKGADDNKYFASNVFEGNARRAVEYADQLISVLDSTKKNDK